MNACITGTVLRRAAITRGANSAFAARVRLASTAINGSPSVLTHALAGIAGGSVVLVGGYTCYHFSGLKTVVTTSQSITAFAKSTKNELQQASSPNEVVEYLRGVSKPYIAVIPGASAYLDSAFDVIDELSKKHATELNEIFEGTIDELKNVGKKGGADLDTAARVFEVLKKRGEQLGKLVATMGEGTIAPILEKHPEIKETIGNGYAQLAELAKHSDKQEAKKLLEDTTKQVQEIFSKGFSTDSINEARKLIQEKTEDIKKIASEEAWDKARKAAGPYLDKIPDVKSLVKDNASVLASSGGVAAIWESIGDSKNDPSKENVDKLKDLVQSKIEEAKKTSASDDVRSRSEGFGTEIPGGEQNIKEEIKVNQK